MKGMDWSLILLLLICIIGGALGQILLKVGVDRIEKDIPLLSQYMRMFTSTFILTGLLLYIGGALIWMKILQRVKLSYAYPLFSLVYVLVALGSKFILKERFNNLLWVAIGMICLGVFLIHISQVPPK